jgi:UPF0716 protein FxsA
MLILLALILVVPIAELVVLLQVADGIGIPETILLLLAVSAVGAWLCKREGVGVVRRIQATVERGKVPTRELVDGGLILLAGALLITPGFLSDLVGILLLLPPSRAVVRSVVLATLARRAQLRITTIPGYGSPGGTGSTGNPGEVPPRVIDVDGR